MGRKTVSVTVTALASAVSIALLYLGSILPTGQLGFTAATVFASLLAASYGGILASVFTYAVTLVLGLIILPVKSQLFLYALFFGYYPILKTVLDKLPYPAAISIKLVAVNLSLMFIKILLSDVFTGVSLFRVHTFFYYIAGSLIFVLFDLGVTKAWQYLQNRLPNMH